MTNNINFDFLLGGYAIFTMGNPTKRYTYKIIKKPDRPFFVYVLRGKDNQNDYNYVGCFIPKGKERYLKLTGKSKYLVTSELVRGFEWAVSVLAGTHPTYSMYSLPNGWFIIHAGKCCACGRRLTTPKSIEKGIGPKCEALKL